WWDRHCHRFETSEQIVNGYLDFFEPDFIVEAESGLAHGLGFDKERVLQLSDVLTRAGDRDRNGCGLSVLNLYQHLYREVFQFARRQEHDIINVVPERASFTALSACLFGAFPTEPDLQYLGKAFTDAFAPKTVSLSGTTLVNLYRSEFT